MSIDVALVGFGDSRPVGFKGQDRCQYSCEGALSPTELLEKSGISPAADLIMMVDDVVIPRARWREPLVQDGARVMVMTAIEGG